MRSSTNVPRFFSNSEFAEDYYKDPLSAATSITGADNLCVLKPLINTMKVVLPESAESARIGQICGLKFGWVGFCQSDVLPADRDYISRAITTYDLSDRIKRYPIGANTTEQATELAKKGLLDQPSLEAHLDMYEAGMTSLGYNSDVINQLRVGAGLMALVVEDCWSEQPLVSNEELQIIEKWANSQ